MRGILLVIGALFVSKGFSAGNETFGVNLVGCYPDGTCFIGIEPSATLTTCGSKEQVRFDITLPGSQAQYSAALAAFSSNKKIRVQLTDQCKDGFPIPGWLHINNF